MTSSRRKKTSGKSRVANRTNANRGEMPAPRKKSAKARPVAKLVVTNASPVKRRNLGPISPIASIVVQALDDMKAVNVKQLDVREQTDIADVMFIASGNSDRHVRAIADRVVEFAKKAGFRPMGLEGEREGEWVLVDLRDVIVHVMLPRVREFYRLESLWDVTAARREAAQQGA